MIHNNNFLINNLENVVFIGESTKFKELIAINNSLKLKTTIITSSDQSRLINKNINSKDLIIIQHTFF